MEKSQTKLTEDRVIHDKNYRYDGIEVVLLRSALTIDEWNQILENQETIESIKEYLFKHVISDDPELFNFLRQKVGY